MLSSLITKKHLMLVSFLAAASLFGQADRTAVASVAARTKSDKQCQPAKEKTCPPVEATHCPCPCPTLNEVTLFPSYVLSARIDTTCPWDFFVEGSFTYWQPMQDNMEVGIFDTEPAVALPAPGNANVITSGNILDMDYDFAPGFKVKLGVNADVDKWDAHAEYTWFRSKNHVSSNAPATTNTQVGEIFPVNTIPSLAQGAFNTASSAWKINMDIVDVVLGRCNYFGRKLTLHPFTGARAAWIRQRSTSNFNSIDRQINSCLINYTSVQTIYSYAIGPEFGLDMNWQIGKGLRFFSTVEGDVLYTRYKVSRNDFRVNQFCPTSGNQSWHSTQKKVGRLRTHFDMEIGMGWGTYFGNHGWYVDLSAAYGFQAFLAQNMFRHFTNDVLEPAESLAPNGSLYIQGLTASADLHF